MPISYRSRTVRKETLHTVSLAAPYMKPGASVLDVGCGEDYVLHELHARGAGEVSASTSSTFAGTAARRSVSTTARRSPSSIAASTW